MRAATAVLLLMLSLPAASGAPGQPAATQPDPDLTLVWEDVFSAAERERLGEWVRRTCAALEGLVGPYPMDVHVHFHRRDGAGEPVPWAHTRRGNRQAVHLHVDPAFQAAAFLNDWTAPHEFSHLLLPYVGRRHAWFAEGFASYLQYPVMVELGVLSPAEARARFERNVRRARRDYSYPRQSFVDAAPRLRAARQYPVMYWGGAAWFRQVDRSLAAQGTSLLEVLRDYVACCRRDRAGLDDLLAELDRLSGGDVFRTGYRTLRNTPGFPDSPGAAGG